MSRDSLVILAILLALIGILGSIALVYLSELKPKELPDTKVQSSPGNKIDTSGTILNEIIPPYATNPIMNIDDYEYNLVFKNEGDRGITKETRDILMSQYPRDWTVRPPSSDLFQQGLASYKESFKETFTNPPENLANPYKEITPAKLSIPDAEILATYVPKKPQELTTYDAADAKEIIDRIYSAKGLVPTVKQTGENVFTIVGTTKKAVDDQEPEELAAVTVAPNPTAGEGTIVVPEVLQDPIDPFFTPSEKTRDGRWNYNKWTPGLERVFAPTEPLLNWY